MVVYPSYSPLIFPVSHALTLLTPSAACRDTQGWKVIHTSLNVKIHVSTGVPSSSFLSFFFFFCLFLSGAGCNCSRTTEILSPCSLCCCAVPRADVAELDEPEHTGCLKSFSKRLNRLGNDFSPRAKCWQIFACSFYVCHLMCAASLAASQPSFRGSFTPS